MDNVFKTYLGDVISKKYLKFLNICGGGLLLGALCLSPAWAEPRPVTLRGATLSDFASPPEREFPAVKAAFKEKAFPLEEAVNFKEMQALTGALSPAEKEYLEKNRFLLRPKPAFLPKPGGGGPPADEMLAWFDSLGGEALRSARTGANARLVTPDVFLHAWHSYLESRRLAAEKGPLAETARRLLAGLYRGAAELRSGAGAAQGDWERLMAQLVIPLILLEEAEGQARGSSTALRRFEGYRDDFSTATAKNIRSELARVYQAEARADNLLGLTPAEGPGPMDYRRFQPQGPYAADPAGRAYWRAAAWLSGLGWDARSESGLADALNCALAMSDEPPARPAAKIEPPSKDLPSAEIVRERPGPAAEDPAAPAETPDAPLSPHQLWVRLTELNTFFFGYPDSPGYLEWLPFLMKESGVPQFQADTSADRGVLARLAASADILAAPGRPYFKDWGNNGPQKSTVLSLMPRRRPPSVLVTDELARREASADGLPLLSSALPLPILAGHQPARALLPRQLALALTSAGQAGPAPDSEPVQNVAWHLAARLDRLAARLQAEPEAAWLATADAGRLRLISTLAGSFGSGHPLYMRSPAFSARQLEAMMGAYAELRHDGHLPLPAGGSPVSPAPSPSLTDEREPAPLVRGLVEPNPAFWQEMIRVAEYTRAGFKSHGLFPEDLGEYGALSRFLKRLERCAALTDKELAGRELSEDDYEFIRLFSLGWMAETPDGTRLSTERLRSGLLAPLRARPPAAENGLTVYEATAEPWLMLALVGNEKSPRLVVGLVYSHYEFAGPGQPRLNDALWQLAAYARYQLTTDRPTPKLPARNFWYEPLTP